MLDHGHQLADSEFCDMMFNKTWSMLGYLSTNFGAKSISGFLKMSGPKTIGFNTWFGMRELGEYNLKKPPYDTIFIHPHFSGIHAWSMLGRIAQIERKPNSGFPLIQRFLITGSWLNSCVIHEKQHWQANFADCG